MDEIWRDVPNVPGVLVSSEGRFMYAPHREPMLEASVLMEGSLRSAFGTSGTLASSSSFAAEPTRLGAWLPKDFTVPRHLTALS